MGVRVQGNKKGSNSVPAWRGALCGFPSDYVFSWLVGPRAFGSALFWVLACGACPEGFVIIPNSLCAVKGFWRRILGQFWFGTQRMSRPAFGSGGMGRTRLHRVLRPGRSANAAAQGANGRLGSTGRPASRRSCHWLKNGPGWRPVQARGSGSVRLYKVLRSP
jgi:hypothetical protein